MYKFFISWFIILCCGYRVLAQQNLVPNGSFEDTTNTLCSGAIDKCDLWFTPTSQGTPDYYNKCASLINYGTPTNNYGSQYASDGSSYAGLVLHGLGTNYREYLSIKLNSTLKANTVYQLSFDVSHADSSNYVNNNIGAGFSNSQLSINTFSTITVFNLVNFDTIIQEEKNWKNIKFSFTAFGSENFLVIGNFFDDNNTSFSTLHSNFINESYYYFDNVKLLETNYKSEALEIPQIFTPNFDGKNDVFKIDYTHFKEENFLVQIFNRWGNSVFQSDKRDFEWDGSFKNEKLSSSTYYVFIKATQKNNSSFIYKGFVQLIK